MGAVALDQAATPEGKMRTYVEGRVGELACTSMIMRWPASRDVSSQKKSRANGSMCRIDDIFAGLQDSFSEPGLF